MIALRSFCLISQRDLGLRKRWRIKSRLVLEMHGDTCGAFAGAIMAVGLKYGHWDVNTLLRQKEEMMNKYAEFRALFLEKFATNSCKELLGYDVSLPEQLEEALSSGRMLDFCPKVVGSVIEMLEEIL